MIVPLPSATPESLLALREARRRRAAPDYVPGAALEAVQAQPIVTASTNTDARLRRSGIPENTWRRRLDPIERGDEESFRDWSNRCARRRGVGVHDGNIDAMEWLEGWEPGHGSVWIGGAVGVGKSLMVAAKAQELLLRPTEMRWVGNGYQVTSGLSVLWTTEIGLQRDFEAFKRFNSGPRFGRRDPSPVDRAMSAAVLVIDDYLSETEAKGFRTDHRNELWSWVISRRYEAGLPVMVTSNRPLDAVELERSPRLSSRLNEMCGGYSIEVKGHDWRKV